MKVTDLPIRGQMIPVEMSVRSSEKDASATFSATVGGKTIGRPTLEELRTALMAETRRQSAKLSIPFSIVVHEHRLGKPQTVIRSGVITGQHARESSKLLIRYDDGMTDQQSAYGSWMQRLSLEEQAELIELSARAAAASAALSQWTEAHALDARKAVAEALAEATAESAD